MNTHFEYTVITMSKAHCLAFPVAVISVLIILTSISAQSTVDDSAFCEPSTFDEVVNLIKQGMSNVGLIKEDLKAVNLIREDLKDVKNVLESSQQQNNASSISKKDLDDLKAACASNQQQCPQTELSSLKQALVSAFVCEYTIVYDFDEA